MNPSDRKEESSMSKDQIIDNSDIHFINKANILIEALPYIQRLWGKTVVIKYGGNAMKSDDLTHKILEDVTLLKYVGINPILVHGGGPEINAMLSRVGMQSSFHNGLRITDAATMEIVQMVLAGKLNKNIVSDIGRLGGKAIGLCGKDAGLITVKKKPPLADGVDLGFVGDIVSINTKLLNSLCADEYIPVISSVGTDENGESYNINADTAAAAIAAALKAEKLIFLTDIDGVRADPADPASLFPVLTVDHAQALIADGTISGGMIPKVTACTDAIEKGVRRVHILNGTIPHPIILEIFTDRGIGTMFELG
ncbi:MAG: acetylglutamate kinase [Clostridia bacterium]|nr:acetylglutamate kinase [Clostridia bacterium]